MKWADNLVLPEPMKQKARDDQLNVLDSLLLSLAQYASGQFPEIPVVVGKKPEEGSSAVQVRCLNIQKEKKTADTLELIFRAAFCYYPQNAADEYEMLDAVFRIQENLSRLDSPIGILICRDFDSEIKDGWAQAACSVRIKMQVDENSFMIEKTNQEVIV